MVNNGFLSVILIAIGLSADCFVVALSGGISKANHFWPRLLRVSFSFGLFQAAMPVLGWLAGKTIVDLIAGYDHWVAFGMLAVVSGRMLWGALRSERSQRKEVDITKGLLLITLSIATSIDALAVGLSFAFLNVNIALASPIIGGMAFVATIIGFKLGNRVGKSIGKPAEAIGALILLAIAFRILLSHIL